MADLLQLTELFNRYRAFYLKAEEPVRAKKFLSDRLSKGDSAIFLAIIPHQAIVAFVQLYPVFSSTRMQRLWVLNDLFVSPAYRGNGISLLLIDRAKEHCRQSDACGFILETEKTNTIANKLYEKLGLTLDEAHNFYSWA